MVESVDTGKAKETQMPQDRLLRWIELCAIGKKTKELQTLRAELIKAYQYSIVNLLQHRDVLRESRLLNRFAQRDKWERVAPKIIEKIAGLPKTLTAPQRELCAFGAFILAGLYQDDEEKRLGIRLYVDELSASLERANHLSTNEDWLEVMTRITTIRGVQEEAQKKLKTQKEIENFLHGRPSNQPLTLDDIEFFYKTFLAALFPKCTNAGVYRNYDLIADVQISSAFYTGRLNKDLRSVFVNLIRGQRREAVIQYLKTYNQMLYFWGGKKALTLPIEFRLETLAWTYGAYVSIHPHPDFNGSIAESLTSHLARCLGIGKLNWEEKEDDHVELDTKNGAIEDWINGNPTLLADWIGSRVRTN